MTHAHKAQGNATPGTGQNALSDAAGDHSSVRSRPRTCAFRPVLQAEDCIAPPIWYASCLIYGGVERQLLVNAKSFTARGAKINLLCQNLLPENVEAEFLEEAKKHFKRIHVALELARQHPQRVLLPQSIMELFSDLPESFFDLTAIYVSVFALLRPRMAHIWNADNVAVILAALLAGIPRIIAGGRSLAPRSRYPLGLESAPAHHVYPVLRFVMQHPSVVMTNNSSAGCADYEDWLGLAPESVVLTPNAVHADQWEIPPPEAEVSRLRTGLGIPERAAVIGGLFRFSAIKNPLLWIRAVSIALHRHSDVYAVCGGIGELWDECGRAVEDAGLGGRLLLPGLLTVTAAFYRMCSVFLLTSQVEGLPNVVLEAQYCGIPVVSTPAGGVVDIIQHEQTGFIVAKGDAPALAACLSFILENPEWGKNAGQKGHEFVARTFSAESSTQKLAAMYASLGVSL